MPLLVELCRDVQKYFICKISKRINVGARAISALCFGRHQLALSLFMRHRISICSEPKEVIVISSIFNRPKMNLIMVLVSIL